MESLIQEAREELDRLQVGSTPFPDVREKRVAEATDQLQWLQDVSKIEEASKKGMPDGTVRTFLMVLTSKVTQYDMRASKAEAKRGRVNIYRLGHMLGEVNDIRKQFSTAELESEAPEDLKKLSALIEKHFVRGFAPATFTMKAIQTFIATGKTPSIVGKQGTRTLP